jgi:predicted DNA-binding transcriptional regulator YafY
MAVNKNALIRYKTIDKCLQNRYRQWTLEDLIDACSDALYEYEGIDKGVSRRTIQSDIQIMRSDKLGYNAPIIVVDKRYYTYEDPEYSITNIPISEQDLSKMSEAVEFLKQFKGFSHFRDLDSMIQKLEDHVYSQQTDQKPVIDFEKNEDLKGIHFLDELYQAIIKKTAIKLTYQSFKARSASSFDFHPYLLKEFRNRWFIVGRKSKGDDILNLALDRIINIEKSSERYKGPGDFNPTEYFKNVIGVTVSKNLPEENIKIKVSHKHAPYVVTKPFHWSQTVVDKDKEGVVFQFQVQHNYELEKDILGFGEAIEVLEPNSLRRSIKKRLKQAKEQYS